MSHALKQRQAKSTNQRLNLLGVNQLELANEEIEVLVARVDVCFLKAITDDARITNCNQTVQNRDINGVDR